jgi:hypothetical protein
VGRNGDAADVDQEATMIEEFEESVQLNALKTILTDAMRIARYTDLETRMAEFEEKLRLDPQSFSPMPQ